MNIRPIALLFILLCNCSGLERSEKDKIKKANLTYHAIIRKSSETILEEQDLNFIPREKYPWEKELALKFSSITKEYFRCKGSNLNPQIQVALDHVATKVLRDCGGIDKHSLPVRDQKEFIYPLLIELLNEVQKKLSAKVIITCGHRCPEHNLYCDQSSQGRVSKHQIGAEVDFYVEGYENKPMEVVQVIRQFYLDHKKYQGLKEFQIFSQLGKNKIENKEIMVLVNGKNERRDYDNRHPYPYLTIELKYDFDTKKKIEYSWQQAHGKIMQN